MLVLVIVLLVTNLATVAVLARMLLRATDHPRPGRAVAAVLDSAPPPPELSSSATRQLITIEILNPIELAGTRGRWAGLAGMLVPGITKRVVHDQAIKVVKRTLAQENVVADVRLHVIRPGEPVRPVIDAAAAPSGAQRSERPDRADRRDRTSPPSPRSSSRERSSREGSSRERSSRERSSREGSSRERSSRDDRPGEAGSERHDGHGDSRRGRGRSHRQDRRERGRGDSDNRDLPVEPSVEPLGTPAPPTPDDAPPDASRAPLQDADEHGLADGESAT